jgi:pyruvate,water dikinase
MNVNEIKGIIASKGIHKGRVIIMPFSPSYDYNKKTNKMKKGDILVAVSTGPEMMAACLKAGAIVTDEGGICSHASIVSRELKIPCIIGTKIATKILKDGDLVELDANKGIIKILKN